jgi:RNA polymerase sigma-70 factor (ECF subfamily)
VEERIRGANTADALVGRLARGDLGALSALYDRYARDIYAVAAHALGRGPAEEVVQDVFVRVWQRASQFEAARGSGAAWIMAIARHRIVDELRRRGRRREVLDTIDDLLERPVDHGLVVHEETPEDGRRREVLDAVRQLPEEQRHVILLAYFGGLTQAEIARELECPLGTVKKRTRLALQKLRASLAERPLVQVLERGVSEEQR